MPPPLPRCSSAASSSLISPRRISLPRKGCRVGLHIVLFEACSAFTRVAACTLARSPIRDRYSRLQPFRYLYDCSDCFRLERIAGWDLHPLESAALSRRTPIAVIASLRLRLPPSNGKLPSVPRRFGQPECLPKKVMPPGGRFRRPAAPSREFRRRGRDPRPRGRATSRRQLRRGW